ncbi:MAG: coenzyme A pyrophosphatase [Salinivirgaceae bacterium]|nr:MAG: coenzyme A pyrophosphatase [Salinivirgaceae bacterium]
MSIDTEKYLKNLKEKLQMELPGSAAHEIMKPGGRVLRPDNDIRPRQSAVLILLYEKNDELELIMIKRAEYDGVHSGQIAFPGGKKESNDNDLMETAFRETKEEVGLNRTQIDIMGKLSPLWIPVSNMCVHPYVGFYNADPIFVIQEKEVQKVLTFPLKELLKEKTITKSIFSGRKYSIEAPCYKVNGEKIWGASAMILSELITILKN